MRLAFLLPALLLLSTLASAAPTPGVTVTFASGEKKDVRDARLVALYVPAGEGATPFLPAAPFTATWDGAIASPLRGDYTFSVAVSGKTVVSINGQPVISAPDKLTSEVVSLKKGANALHVEYQSPAQGDAFIRLYWSSKEFPPEPVPPTSLTHEADAPELHAAAQIREGRLLFAERRCAACHDAAAALPAAGQGMPELAQDAPVFAEFGARFHENWLAHWINDPASIRPHTPMPRVFAGKGDGVDPRAADLAAYLISLGQPKEGQIDEQNVPLGGALFANLGCIACHTTPDFQGEDEAHRVPLAHLKAKWQEPALREYLRNPQQYYRWTRMPNFRLTDEESTRLAAYLLSGTQREFADVPKGDAAKGGQLAVTSGCLNCHAGLPPTTAPKLAETLKAGWLRGCLADDPAQRGAAPDFHLEPAQREALRALAAAGFDSLKTDSAAEFMHRQVKNLRCNACHGIDGEPSTWSQMEGEMAPLQAGAPTPEGEGVPIAGTVAPAFTWLGEKLRPEWSAQFIAGGITYKPRPWLIARMPGFGVRAELLAHGLALDHGFSTVTPKDEPVDPVKIKGGETLIGENGGFNCTTCHGVGERPPTAVFEAPGINLAYSHERLRHEYYHRWVYFPQRIDPETKMPRFSDDEGKTPLTDLFEGNAREQFEAIWQYLGTVSKPPETPK